MITNITDSVQVLKVRIYNKQIFAIAETDKKKWASYQSRVQIRKPFSKHYSAEPDKYSCNNSGSVYCVCNKNGIHETIVLQAC